MTCRCSPKPGSASPTTPNPSSRRRRTTPSTMSGSTACWRCFLLLRYREVDVPGLRNVGLLALARGFEVLGLIPPGEALALLRLDQLRLPVEELLVQFRGSGLVQ